MAVERGGIPVGVLADAADGGEATVGGWVLAWLPPEVGPPPDVPGVAVRGYIVERTTGWPHSCRRLLVRHEWYAHLYDGFLHRACALIATGKM